MRWTATLMAIVCLAFWGSGATADNFELRAHILLIGNSLTYFGNLPAVLDAMSVKNGHRGSSDMIVAPGATLTDLAKTGVVSRALEGERYSFVVLQERGGDFIGSFGPQATQNAKKSLAVLAGEIRRHGATPFLLGTYQSLPESSKLIEEAEGNAARALGIVYIPMSERLRIASTAQPQLAWIASDGMHPGPDLTLLYALLAYIERYTSSNLPTLASR